MNAISKPLKTIFSCLFILSVVLIGCSGDENKKTEADDYEKGKINLLELEQKRPEKFLNVTNSYKKNLLGQSVIKGDIINNAKVAAYQDIELKLSFYSKTGVLLEEDVETIFEKIEAGQSKSFKSKYFTPKGTDSVSIAVEKAIVAK